MAHKEDVQIVLDDGSILFTWPGPDGMRVVQYAIYSDYVDDRDDWVEHLRGKVWFTLELEKQFVVALKNARDR